MSQDENDDTNENENLAHNDPVYGPSEESTAVPLPPPESQLNPPPPKPDPRPTPGPPPPAEPPPASSTGTTIFSILAALVLIGLLAAGWYFGMGPGAKNDQDSANVADVDSTDREASAPEPHNAQVETMKSDIQSLKERIDAMREKVDALAKASPAQALMPIQEKLGTLDEVSGTVQDLSQKLTATTQRLDTVEESVNSFVGVSARMQEDISQLKEAVKTTAAEIKTTEPAGSSSPSEPKPVSAGPTLSEGLEQVSGLVEERQYEDAQPILRELRRKFPTDARVWYYSALANGFESGNWEGETLEFVHQGAARERVGTPESSVIDTTFNDLPSQTRNWLNYYRRQGQ